MQGQRRSHTRNDRHHEAQAPRVPVRRLLGAAIAVTLLGAHVTWQTTTSLAEEDPGPGVATVVDAGTTYAVIKTVTVGDTPYGIAVNDADDTVYVASFESDNVSIIRGSDAAVDSTQAYGATEPEGVTVDQSDDTIYVANFGSNTVTVITGSAPGTGTNTTGFSDPLGVAVNNDDDTVYVTNSNDGSMSIFPGSAPSATPKITVGATPRVVAVDQDDDTVYVADNSTDLLRAIVGTNTDDSFAVPVLSDPWGLAVNSADDTVYVTDSQVDVLTVLNGRNLDDSVIVPVGNQPRQPAVYEANDLVFVPNGNDASVTILDGAALDDSVTLSVGSSPRAVAVDQQGTNAGLAYVTNSGNATVSVIGRVSPASTPTTGKAGATVTVSVTVANLASGFSMNDATIQSVSFGSAAGTSLTRSTGNTWTVVAPSGSGTVPVTVTFDGGLSASAGTFAYQVDPTPPVPVVVPPSAPLYVMAVAGDDSALITWSAPSSAGTFPITEYQAVVSPGNVTCIATGAERSCVVEELVNGQPYTAVVRALNGAGWGPYSTPTEEFTPQPSVIPSIVITGSREQVRNRPGVKVDGTTTGLDGATVRARVHLAGEVAYRDGVTRTVDAQGNFTWQRVTRKKVYVYFRVDGEQVRSNRVIISPR